MGIGADFLVGNSGPKKAKPALRPNGIRVEPDEIDALLADTAGKGKKLASGIDSARSSLDALATSGLTFECLVVLVEEKCVALRTPGGRNLRPSRDQVRGVLTALFSIDEYLR